MTGAFRFAVRRGRWRGLCLLVCWLAGVGRGMAQSGPRLLLTGEDLARIERLSKTAGWAAAVRNAVIESARAWPAAHLERFGLEQWAVPPEGGQWSQHYVCPVHGVSLQFRPPDQHRCPVDGKTYSGWPYDQVIYTRRHNDNAAGARDNALAWQFTRRSEFAQWAARILLAYADVYLSYPLKDPNNRPDTSGAARVTAQTLDEAQWLIAMAWAYDLIRDSEALDAAQRAHIENDLLRPAAQLIARNNRTRSNWQSWHNAALAAVGFTLGDEELVWRAIHGSGGFYYQMRESVLPDGLWWEGAWGYHFYALDPLCQLAEMAARAGMDLWAEEPLRRMFTTPLLFALPDGTLPNFNDSRNVSLESYDRLYEIGYARYGDPLLAWVLGRRARGREALFWGAETLPAPRPPDASSVVFEDSGNAILRVAGSDHYVAFKFGPHGGGHGHYDKLNFISFWAGAMMAVDPGTQSYAAPTHNTWDKVTVAHNTVVVDETTQAEATGRLHGFALLPSISAVRADAGDAYRQADLIRGLILTPEYLLDVFEVRSRDGQEHRYDWVYHNFGTLESTLPLETYTQLPKSAGYQHLSRARAAVTDADWQVNFDMNPSSAAYGSTWTSVAGIRAAYEYSREQAAEGRFSGKLSYDFSAAGGYILYHTPTLRGLPEAVPAGVRLKIYGDGSGHRLAIRLYDTTDERFVYTVGRVDWTGWREIEAEAPEGWSHYLGNNDGKFDPPVKTVSIEWTQTAGGPPKGAIYVDEILLDYGGSGRILVADFERRLRNLRVWMLGAPETTVVVGEGLGPDLLVPVPFVMARRRGRETRFVTLLEPWSEAPAVTAFQLLPDGGFRLSADAFEDRVWFGSEGRLRYLRSQGGELRRLGLAGETRLVDEQDRLWLELPARGSAEVNYSAEGASVEIQLSEAMEGELRVLAPRARQVTLNGEPASFRAEDGYCVITLPARR